MKHHERVELFHERMQQLIEESGLNQSRFATSIGVDRSTLSQLLSLENVRLPRADTLVAIAEKHQVSIDWLLGLTQEGFAGADIIPGPREFENFGDSDLNSMFIEWHQQSTHYKVRYVPATLPDLLKTETTASFEFRRYGEGKTDQAIRGSQLLLMQQRSPNKEMEVCQSLQSLRAFALGHGIWQDLEVSHRREQIEYMIGLCDELYPRFRWFLFNGREAYTVPFTVYGPLRAVVFLGQLYLVFNNIDDIEKLALRFDDLIRIAVVQPHEISDNLRRLLAEIQ